MSELYWIMVLDNVCFVSNMVMIIAGLIAACAWVVSFICYSETDGIEDETDSDWLSYKKRRALHRRSSLLALSQRPLPCSHRARNRCI